MDEDPLVAEGPWGRRFAEGPLAVDQLAWLDPGSLDLIWDLVLDPVLDPVDLVDSEPKQSKRRRRTRKFRIRISSLKIF